MGVGVEWIADKPVPETPDHCPEETDDPTRRYGVLVFTDTVPVLFGKFTRTGFGFHLSDVFTGNIDCQYNDRRRTQKG
ncbi:hypothetical protein D1872_345780 [compost metagenome]